MTEDILKFRKALGSHSSDKHEYKRNERGDYIMPMEYGDIWVEYLNIGNNIEFDSFGMLEEYIYMHIHVRDVKNITDHFIIDMLAHIRKYFIDRTKDVQYSKPYRNVIEEDLPKDYKVKVSRVLLDPGFQGHERTDPKTGGITISTASIYHPDAVPPKIVDDLEGSITLFDLLFNPESVYSKFVIPNVDPINNIMGVLQNRLHEKKRLDVYHKALLSKKHALTQVLHYRQDSEGHFTGPYLSTEDIYGEGVIEPVKVYYEWFGPIPNMVLSVDAYSSDVHGEFSWSKKQYGKEYGFKIWIEANPHVRQHIQNSTDNFIEAVKKQMRRDFKRYNIEPVFIDTIQFIIQN